MVGHQVVTMNDAASYADIFVTATGCGDVVTGKHITLLARGRLVNLGRPSGRPSFVVPNSFTTR